MWVRYRTPRVAPLTLPSGIVWLASCLGFGSASPAQCVTATEQHNDVFLMQVQRELSHHSIQGLSDQPAGAGLTQVSTQSGADSEQLHREMSFMSTLHDAALAAQWTSMTYRCHTWTWWLNYKLPIAGGICITGITVMAFVYVITTKPLMKEDCPCPRNWKCCVTYPLLCTFSVFGACLMPFGILVLIYKLGIDGRLEFVHIPKNAGTTIEELGWEAGIPWSRYNHALKGYQKMPDGNECMRYHTPPPLLDNHIYQHSHVFCLVRHPYDRAISEYLFLLDEPLQKKYGRKAWGHKNSQKYGNGLYDEAPCTPKGLNNFVQTTLALYNRGYKYIDDCHHVAQSDFIWDAKGRKWCSEVLRTEDLPEAFNDLMQQHGYDVRISKERDYSAASFCPNVTVHWLDNASRQMLTDTYADDFRLLGYTAF